MHALDKLAEQQLAQAVARGEFSNLPGAGEPLCLDDDALVPEELRASYRILRNAGYVPEPVRCAAELATLLEQPCGDDDARGRAALSRRMTMLAVQLGERFTALQNQAYRQQTLTRLASGVGAPASQSDDEPEPPSGCRGE